MKRTLTLLTLAAGTLSMQSQNFVEDFTAPWNPATQGWVIQNLSASPNPTLAWFQGNGAQTFTAYNGGPNDYVAANFNNTQSQSPATISNWLITPTLNLVNGGVLSFATRIMASPTNFPDRLEVYMSTAGSGTNVGNTPTSVGTFSTLIESVNPNLTGTGYPDIWTVYTVTLSGLSGPTVGRIGFRYHVPNGGPQGSNSDYIGLDAVNYNAGCAATINSYTVCPGNSATLVAIDASPSASFTWQPGGMNTSSVVVNPAATTEYTLNYDEASGACPPVTATVTIGSNLSMQASASSQTVCAGESVTLTVEAAATNFSWFPTGGTSTVAVVTPTASTIYTAGALQGLCFGTVAINITVNQLPPVSVNAATLHCTTGQTVALPLVGQGADDYMWIANNGQFVSFQPSINLNAPATVTAPITFTYDLVGFSDNGCFAITTNSIYIDAPAPTPNASASKSIECINRVISLNAAGSMGGYSWSGETTSTAQSFTYATGNTPGVKSWTVVGYSQFGCESSPAVVTMTVDACVGIAKFDRSQHISVYPNPFFNQLNVSNMDGTIFIYNNLGQQLIAQGVKGSAQINTENLPKGVYIIKAVNAEGNLISTTRMVRD